MKTVVYGIGGHDPSKPNNNIVEIIEFEEPSSEISPEESSVEE